MCINLINSQTRDIFADPNYTLDIIIMCNKIILCGLDVNQNILFEKFIPLTDYCKLFNYEQIIDCCQASDNNCIR